MLTEKLLSQFHDHLLQKGKQGDKDAAGLLDNAVRTYIEQKSRSQLLVLGLSLASMPISEV